MGFLDRRPTSWARSRGGHCGNAVLGIALVVVVLLLSPEADLGGEGYRSWGGCEGKEEEEGRGEGVDL